MEKLEKLKSVAVALYEKDETSAYDLGKALVAVRTECKAYGKGEFGKWLKEKKINLARANYCMQKFEGKREKPATTTKDVPYISTLDKPILSCFAEMKAEALDGNVDDVKLLAEKLRDETRAIEAAIKHYVAAAEQKASAKVLYNAVPVESFHGVRKVDNSVAA